MMRKVTVQSRCKDAAAQSGYLNNFHLSPPEVALLNEYSPKGFPHIYYTAAQSVCQIIVILSNIYHNPQNFPKIPLLPPSFKSSFFQKLGNKYTKTPSISTENQRLPRAILLPLYHLDLRHFCRLVKRRGLLSLNIPTALSCNGLTRTLLLPLRKFYDCIL